MTTAEATQAKKAVRKDAYQRVVDQIISQLEAGKIPWEKPWISLGFTPRNAVTGHEYRGMNAFVLSCDNRSPFWITWNQVQKIREAQYKKTGSQGTGYGEKIGVKQGKEREYQTVFFWKFFSREEEDPKTGETKTRKSFFLKTFNVYNIEDVDLPTEFTDKLKKQEKELKELRKLQTAETVLAKFKDAPEITYGGDRAYYRPATDSIGMPLMKQFKTSEEFYSTIFHEMCHSTGHTSRLNRKTVMDTNLFGSHEYSKEELIAEFGAAFLCAEAGIGRTIKNSAAYIQSWLEVLKGDPRMVIMAASQAQKAADWVMGAKPRGQQEPEEEKQAA